MVSNLNHSILSTDISFLCLMFSISYGHLATEVRLRVSFMQHFTHASFRSYFLVSPFQLFPHPSHQSDILLFCRCSKVVLDESFGSFGHSFCLGGHRRLGRHRPRSRPHHQRQGLQIPCRLWRSSAEG